MFSFKHLPEYLRYTWIDAFALPFRSFRCRVCMVPILHNAWIIAREIYTKRINIFDVVKIQTKKPPHE